MLGWPPCPYLPHITRSLFPQLVRPSFSLSPFFSPQINASGLLSVLVFLRQTLSHAVFLSLLDGFLTVSPFLLFFFNGTLFLRFRQNCLPHPLQLAASHFLPSLLSFRHLTVCKTLKQNFQTGGHKKKSVNQCRTSMNYFHANTK